MIGEVLSQLKVAERTLATQLEGVRAAIKALDGGEVARRGRPPAAQPIVRRRRRLSAKARAAISAAQKLRWAKHRAAK